jgi:DnaJ-class molecular chaperone
METDIRTLIDTAMATVRISVCERCRGEREIGLPTLRAPCPGCGGRGLSTTSELETDGAH